MSMGLLLSEMLAYEEYLKEMLANCRKQKDLGDLAPRGRSVTLAELPVVWLLGSSQMEQQAFAQGSARGINANFDKNQGRGKKTKSPKQSSGDRTLDLLSEIYNREMDKCREQNIKDNESYFRCRARKGATAEDCKGFFIQMTCPAGLAAGKALSEYLKSRTPNSGGGSGGGF